MSKPQFSFAVLSAPPMALAILSNGVIVETLEAGSYERAEMIDACCLDSNDPHKVSDSIARAVTGPNGAHYPGDKVRVSNYAESRYSGRTGIVVARTECSPGTFALTIQEDIEALPFVDWEHECESVA